MLAEEAARITERALGMFLKWDVVELIRNYSLKLWMKSKMGQGDVMRDRRGICYEVSA